jgi:hypothetical protein
MTIGKITLKEWILIESQTNFCTTDHMEKSLGRHLRRWSETTTGHLA